jgi:predicted ATP-dependent endonuclease of OLD family
MTTSVNEGFFADAVVVVEGLTELGLLWALQEQMEKNWDRRGIVVVPAEGKTKIDRPVVVFRGLEIPTYFVFDGDSKHRGKGNKDEKSTMQVNHLMLNLAESAPVDFPPTQVHRTWAVFGNDVESELSAALGAQELEKARAEIADELGYSDSTKVLKNPEAAARLMRRVYKDGKRVPVLEEIVESVSALI